MKPTSWISKPPHWPFSSVIIGFLVISTNSPVSLLYTLATSLFIILLIDLLAFNSTKFLWILTLTPGIPFSLPLSKRLLYPVCFLLSLILSSQTVPPIGNLNWVFLLAGGLAGGLVVGGLEGGLFVGGVSKWSNSISNAISSPHLPALLLAFICKLMWLGYSPQVNKGTWKHELIWVKNKMIISKVDQVQQE